MIKIPPQKPEKLTSIDCIITALISFAAFIVNFYRIDHPDTVCFDEVHFGNFTNWYSLSQYFFDIHPPIGKLVMYAIANFSEYNASINFETFYRRNHNTTEYIILRMTPALFSALCFPMMYLSMRFSSFSYTSSSFGALLAMFDTSLLTEHRFTLSDGLLHFFSCLFLMIYAYCSTSQPNTEIGNKNVLISGIFLGAACACKNTAWGLMGYVAYVETLIVFQYFKKINDDFLFEYLYRGMINFGLVIIIHLIGFFIHMFLLPYTGRDNDSSDEHLYINRDFPTAELWGKRLQFPNLYIRTVQLVIGMHLGNMQITSFHPYMSRPINWPLLTGNYVAFWHSGKRSVACMGNLFVYYIAFIGVIAVVINPIKLFFNFIKKKFLIGITLLAKKIDLNYRADFNDKTNFNAQKWLIATRYSIGWAFSYFPFFLIPRSMFLYHYNIPLMIGCMAAGASLDLWFPRYYRGIAAVFLLALAVFGFYLWSPISYGTDHLPDEYVFWKNEWRNGDKFHQKLASLDRQSRFK